jgi:hypothetical protein
MKITAGKAWAGLAAGVVAYDLLCPDGQMLSEGVDRGLEQHRLATGIAIGVTALHLLNILPESVDPFSVGLSGLKRITQ